MDTARDIIPESNDIREDRTHGKLLGLPSFGNDGRRPINGKKCFVFSVCAIFLIIVITAVVLLAIQEDHNTSVDGANNTNILPLTNVTTAGNQKSSPLSGSEISASNDEDGISNDDKNLISTNAEQLTPSNLSSPTGDNDMRQIEHVKSMLDNPRLIQAMKSSIAKTNNFDNFMRSALQSEEALLPLDDVTGEETKAAAEYLLLQADSPQRLLQQPLKVLTNLETSLSSLDRSLGNANEKRVASLVAGVFQSPFDKDVDLTDSGLTSDEKLLKIQSLWEFLSATKHHRVEDDVDKDGLLTLQNLDLLEKMEDVIDELRDVQSTQEVDRFFSENLNRLEDIWMDMLERQNNFGLNQLFEDMEESGAINLSSLLQEDVPSSEKRDAIKMATLASSMARSFTAGEEQNEEVVSCNDETELACNDGSGCYYLADRCDGWIKCADNSDEMDCTCLDYVNTTQLCDGYHDCLHGEDEIGCHCPSGNFYCGLDDDGRPICIPLDQRCDNVYDCRNGEDERYCHELNPKPYNPATLHSVPHDSGYLHVRVGHSWGMLSVEFVNNQNEPQQNDYFQSLAAKVCSSTQTYSEIIPRVSVIPSGKVENLLQVAHLVIDLDQPNYQSNIFEGGRYRMSLGPPHDDSDVLWVDCGEPSCGFRSEERLRKFSRLSLQEEEEVSADATDDGSSIQTRIIGGEKSYFGDWPFIATLSRNGQFICSATIINRFWVLTAAHCLQGYDSDESFYYQLRVGLYRRNAISSQQYFRTIGHIYLHPSFDDSWLESDIALARVTEPFVFSYVASPICLPDAQLCADTNPELPLMEPTSGAVCFTIGWGSIDQIGTVSMDLRQLKIPIHNECVKSYNNIENQVCGGYFEGGRDACLGDSGGPLFCQNPRSPDVWYLGGVISHSEGCARPETPGVYTRVCMYTEWIEKTMNAYDLVVKSDQSPDGVEGDEAPSHSANLVCPTFTCDSGMCMEQDKMCNYKVDCFDGFDELNCIFDSSGIRQMDASKPVEVVVVQSPPIRPSSSHIIAPTGSIHTIDTTISRTCQMDEYQCKRVFQCIPIESRCDMKIDCIDKTDEISCGCRDRIDDEYICDSYPDCTDWTGVDWTDEVGCVYGSNRETGSFYCELSKQSIPITKVCDLNSDCQYNEDERYCITLVNMDSISMTRDGRPQRNLKGLIAIQKEGVWKTACVHSWAKKHNDGICRYIGSISSIEYVLHSKSNYPHFGNSRFSLRQPTARSIIKRSVENDISDDIVKQISAEKFKSSAVDVLSSETKEVSLPELRSLGDSQDDECRYVESTCSPVRSCGTMPLYSFLGQETPIFGPGVFPWTVNLYLNGDYMCGGTLIHKDWVMMGTSCARKAAFSGWVAARMGGFRDSPFLAAHEQYRRVIQIVNLPDTSISMGRFDNSVRMNEYVNCICMTINNWIPIQAKCVLTGNHGGVLNDVFETKMLGRCNTFDRNSQTYDLCTRRVTSDDKCLQDWSGAIACPDDTFKYYAMGVYHSISGGCGKGVPPPSTFESLVSSFVRNAIYDVIANTEVESPLPDDNCKMEEGRYRCPHLGKCLEASQVCDGLPQCPDFSDEDSLRCGNYGLKWCQHINSTHCKCPNENDMMCNNSLCLDKGKFCDGVDDCGDVSDEPDNCQDCIVRLKYLNPEKLCDHHIDCLDTFGADESASLCCPSGRDYRCILGSANGPESLEPLQCLPLEGVCDGNLGPDDETSCVSGADELDCISLWDASMDETPLPTTDIFGRSNSSLRGFLYFVNHGQNYLYCASLRIFQVRLLDNIGTIICNHEHGMTCSHIELLEPVSRQRGGFANLSPREIADFNTCKNVYIECDD